MASVISEASNRTSRTFRSTSQRFSNRSLGDFSLYDLIAEQSNTKTNESSDDPTIKITSSDWESVKRWFRNKSPEEARQAASQMKNSTSVLHIACKHQPPMDIIKVLVNVSPRSVKIADSYGCLPLHYACHHGASTSVLKILIRAYPEATIESDIKGRNPLHFAVGNTVKKEPFESSILRLLSERGACACADDKLMLPLHYAVSYGASEEVLQVLYEENPRGIRSKDINGLTPLHFVFGNCERAESPKALKFLLSKEPNYLESVSSPEESLNQHPIYILANRSRNFFKDGADVERRVAQEEEERRENVYQCLDLYLESSVYKSRNFFTAMKSLPIWLSDRAVANPVVQEYLNKKMSNRFLTVVVMLDMYALVAIIITYYITIIESIDRRYEDDKSDNIPVIQLIPLYLGGIYFLLREIIQSWSWFHLGIGAAWFQDANNWIDVVSIILIFFWAIVMNTGAMGIDSFRSGAAITLFLFWLNFLRWIRSLLVEFAVFVSGVIHVVQRLGAFLLASLIILVAFNQVFFTIFQQTEYCDGFDADDREQNVCDPADADPAYRFCSRRDTFLNVLTMLLGEVDDGDFKSSTIGIFFFCVFVFLVVILLANVLIAIVTDSFRLIRNERAAIVFWSNRLDFIAGMDVISSGPWKENFNGSDEQAKRKQASDRYEQLWDQLMDYFDEDLHRLDMWLVRIVIATIIIPTWLIFGLLTAGWMWPPQVRKSILEQKITARDTTVVSKVDQLTREAKNSIDQICTDLKRDIAENEDIYSDITESLEDMRLVLQEINYTQKRRGSIS